MFNQLFKVSDFLNVIDNTAVIIIAAVIGAVVILHLFIGRLSLSAYSDTLYGIGLIFSGLLVTELAFKYLRYESYLHGFDHIVKETPKKLNAWGAVDSTIVPWPTLMFGMFFNNFFLVYKPNNCVDMTPWKYRYVAGIAVLAVIVVSYIIFSPLGVAA